MALLIFFEAVYWLCLSRSLEALDTEGWWLVLKRNNWSPTNARVEATTSALNVRCYCSQLLQKVVESFSKVFSFPFEGDGLRDQGCPKCFKGNHRLSKYIKFCKRFFFWIASGYNQLSALRNLRKSINKKMGWNTSVVIFSIFVKLVVSDAPVFF